MLGILGPTHGFLGFARRLRVYLFTGMFERLPAALFRRAAGHGSQAYGRLKELSRPTLDWRPRLMELFSTTHVHKPWQGAISVFLF